MKDAQYHVKDLFLNGVNKVYIEIETEDFGRVLMLDQLHKNTCVPVSFDTKEEAQAYIDTLMKR